MWLVGQNGQQCWLGKNCSYVVPLYQETEFVQGRDINQSGPTPIFYDLLE